jgi:hypothetical protein
MEPGRMPLPTTRHTLPNVDSSRSQRPGADPCAHAQVDCLLWRGELGDREIRIQLVRHVRRKDVREVLDGAAAPTYSGKAHGHRPGQRPIPPCQTARAIAAQISQSIDAPVPAAVQPTVSTYRASLETHPSPGNPQPVLRDTCRGARRRAGMLRSMDKAELGIETTMRHYLRRYV